MNSLSDRFLTCESELSKLLCFMLVFLVFFVFLTYDSKRSKSLCDMFVWSHFWFLDVWLHVRTMNANSILGRTKYTIYGCPYNFMFSGTGQTCDTKSFSILGHWVRHPTHSCKAHPHTPSLTTHPFRCTLVIFPGLTNSDE
jgi:hypothetical protein